MLYLGYYSIIKYSQNLNCLNNSIQAKFWLIKFRTETVLPCLLQWHVFQEVTFHFALAKVFLSANNLQKINTVDTSI